MITAVPACPRARRRRTGRSDVLGLSCAGAATDVRLAGCVPAAVLSVVAWSAWHGDGTQRCVRLSAPGRYTAGMDVADLPAAPLHTLLDALNREPARFAGRAGLAARVAALDTLERWCPPHVAVADATWVRCVRDAQSWLQNANAATFAAVRAQVMAGDGCAAMRAAIRDCRAGMRASEVEDGGYDALDELVAGVLQMPEPAPPQVELGADMVFYQPTPVRHVLALIERARLQAHDVVVDLGSGLGLVPMMVAMLSPARSIGVELEPSYVASARACAGQLGLSRVTFVAADVRQAALSSGTVFYLYTPFRGSVLREVLGTLRAHAMQRVIRVCSYGPCTDVLAGTPWLHAEGKIDRDTVTVFHARL